MRRIVVIATVVAVVALPGVAWAAGGAPGTLSVIGQGRTFVRPDTADIDATVRHVARTAQAARANVSQRARAVIAAVRARGVPDSAIQTPSIVLTRRTLAPRHHGGSQQVRYAASEDISVHLVDIRLVAAVLDAATRAGADDLSGPSFGFSSPTLGRPAAERAALRDARQRADAAAADMGLRVVGVQSIDLDPNGQGIAGQPGSSSAPSAGSQTTPVRPGRQEVDAQVAVVFLIAAA